MTDHSAIRQFLSEWLTHQHARDVIPGFVVHVMHGTETIFSDAFGWADVNKRLPMSADHVFNVGSQAKLVTSLAIMQLTRGTDLDIDDAAAHHLHWLRTHRTERVRRLSIRDLLSHGAGLPRDSDDADYWQGAQPFPSRESLRRFVLASQPVVDEGTWKYSNVGYGLLGEVIETVTAKTYANYIRDHVARPVGLTSLQVDRPDGEGLLCASYGRQQQPFAPPQALDAFASAAGIFSSVPDIARLLMSCALDQTIVDRRDWNLMTTARDLQRSRRSYSYGLGVEIMKFDDRTVVGHSGGAFGFRTCAFLDQERSIAVAVGANSIDAPIVEMCRGVFGAVAHLWDTAAGSTFDGIFRNAWEDFHVVTTAERIVTVDPNSWTPFRWIGDELTVVGADALRVTWSSEDHFQGENLTYEREGDGSVRSVRLGGVTASPVELR